MRRTHRNLDSKTGQQIIELFKGLNRQDGITLLLVTQERRVSDVAHRVLRIEDGRIVDEEIIDHSKSGTFTAVAQEEKNEDDGPDDSAPRDESAHPTEAERAATGESES